MYNHFFSFKERPFKLVPDPDYLFLSRAHEEALAHLKYAAVEGDGFVEIIGEVGTGKTMLCRAFLESLGPGTETAYIFNPKMDALRLLQAINDEFGIRSDFDQTKPLIDTLNAFLIEEKKNGRKVLLIIDEAQNLGKDVLEQIRLLSNLETTKEKLLQIILVGQPELGELLDSYELRQLGQRISLSCRLRPLDREETRKYIIHRLNVAAQKTPVRFTWDAFRRIFRFSRGIPRLINIACDRSLLVAYGMGRKKVDGIIARTALQELYTRGEVRRRARIAGSAGAFAALLCAGVVVGIYFFNSDFAGKKIFGRSAALTHTRTAAREAVQKKSAETSAGNPSIASEAAKSNNPGANPAAAPPAPAAALSAKPAPAATSSAASAEPLLPETQQPAQTSAPELSGYLAAATSTPYDGMTRLLELWQETGAIPIPMDNQEDEIFFSGAARQSGLSVIRVNGDLSLIRKLNVPAILKFETPDRPGPVYLTIKQADAGTMTLSGPDREITASDREIAASWTGTAFVFWKDFLNLQGVIGLDSPEDSVSALKTYLRQIGYKDLAENSVYDIDTRRAIKEIQAARGIYVDGYVGPVTKIILYNEKSSLKIPHLTSPRPIMAEGADSK